jgi:hypothetical protein
LEASQAQVTGQLATAVAISQQAAQPGGRRGGGGGHRPADRSSPSAPAKRRRPSRPPDRPPAHRRRRAPRRGRRRRPSAPGGPPIAHHPRPGPQPVPPVRRAGGVRWRTTGRCLPNGLYMGAFQFSQPTWNVAAQAAGLPSLVGVAPEPGHQGRAGHRGCRPLRPRRPATRGWETAAADASGAGRCRAGDRARSPDASPGACAELALGSLDRQRGRQAVARCAPRRCRPSSAMGAEWERRPGSGPRGGAPWAADGQPAGMSRVPVPARPQEVRRHHHGGGAGIGTRRRRRPGSMDGSASSMWAASTIRCRHRAPATRARTASCRCRWPPSRRDPWSTITMPTGLVGVRRLRLPAPKSSPGRSATGRTRHRPYQGAADHLSGR